MRPDERADARRTSAFWDALVAGEPLLDGGPEEHLIRQLHRLDDAPHIRATFAARLGTRLMPPDSRVTRGSAQARKARSMHAIPTSRPTFGKPIPGRRLPSIPKWFPSAATVLVVVMLLGSAFGGEFNNFLNHEPERKQLAALDATNESTPQSTPESDSSTAWPGGTAGGNAARDGVNPGPGPVGEPSIAWQTEAGLWSYTPVIDGEHLYTWVTDDASGTYAMQCLAIETGLPCWDEPHMFEREGPGAIGHPTVVGNLLYVALGVGIYALDTTTGDEIWLVPHVGYMSSRTLVVADGIVAVQYDSRVFVGLDSLTGDKVWRTGEPAADAGPLGFGSTLSIANGLVIGPTDQEDVVALDLQTGQQVWRFATGSGLYLNSAPVTISGGFVYFSARDDDVTNRIYALNGENGEQAWPPMTVYQNTGLAAADGTLYISSGEPGLPGSQPAMVQAVDGATGEIRWTVEGAGRGWPIVLVGDSLYAPGVVPGTVIALNTGTGEISWEVYVGTTYSFVVTSGFVIADGDGSIKAITGDGGTTLADQPTDLSGLPECATPRLTPVSEVTGQPALTFTGETQIFEIAGTPVPGDDRFSPLPNGFPQILSENVPQGQPPDNETRDDIVSTIEQYATCFARPEFRGNPAGFYSDDFFRRGYGFTTNADGNYIITNWVSSFVDDNGEFSTSYVLHTLDDGRIAFVPLLGGGEIGEMVIFANVDGVWLIDEYYTVVDDYFTEPGRG